MTDLLEAVDALTQPVIEHIAQKSDTGKWLKAHTVTRPPLLQQMADAVTPSSNRTAGSAASADTRTPIDLGALFEYRKMAAQIGDWCRIVNIPPTRDAVTDLRRWYTARLAIADGEDRFYIRALTAWGNTIRNYLEPPESFVPEYGCPVCGATTWGDMINGGGPWPIEVKYRVDEQGITSDEVALCRPCRAVWEGHDAIVELSDEMKEKQA
ncbi:MAG: hypothetical protein ABWY57_15930 [Mycetocola sp.]